MSRALVAALAASLALAACGGGSNSTSSSIHALTQTLAINAPEVIETGRVEDIVIDGATLLAWQTTDGQTVFAREARLEFDSQDRLVSPTGGYLLVAPPGSDEGLAPDPATLVPLQVVGLMPAKASTRVTLGFNLDARNITARDLTLFDPLDPETYQHAMALGVVLAAGRTRPLTVYAGAAGAEDWWLVWRLCDTTVGSTRLAFNSDGSPQADWSALSLNVNEAQACGDGSDTTQRLTLDLSEVVQYGSSFSVWEMTTDGWLAGSLSALEFSADGWVQARYSNGQAPVLGRVPGAQFGTSQGFARLRAGWLPSHSDAVEWRWPGTSLTGDLRSGAYATEVSATVSAH